jgi:hypothetical protein
MTSMTITNSYGSFTITVNQDDMNFGDFVEEVAIPALSAVYSYEIVTNWLRDGEE